MMLSMQIDPRSVLKGEDLDVAKGAGQAMIAFMSGAIPRICMARFRLYASTCKLISALTRGIVLVKKCVAPIQELRMFDRPAAYARSLWCAVQPPLHRVEYVLVFPPRDAPIIAGRAFGFDGTSWAG